MKKSFVVSAVSAFLLSSAAVAGEYYPYVGLDYASMAPDFSGKYDSIAPENYDFGSLNAGLKFVDLGSVEVFAKRSLREKNSYNGNVSRGRFYGYGIDLLYNAYNLTDATLLASIGYERLSSKLKFNGSTDKDDGNAVRLGIGGEINPTPEWGFRAMYRYSFSDSDAFDATREFSLGLRYYFYY